MIPTGSITPAWNAQPSSAVVEGSVVPKVVAVTYVPFEEPVLDFIENYWKELGAETVLMDPWPGGPADPCDALVLKYKDAGVEYWDMHTIELPELHPRAGPGGLVAAARSREARARARSTSSTFIGKPMADLGVIAGAPTTQSDGSPVHTSPTPATQEYVDSMNEVCRRVHEHP